MWLFYVKIFFALYPFFTMLQSGESNDGKPTVLVSVATVPTDLIEELKKCANVVHYSPEKDGQDLRKWVKANLPEASVFCFGYQPYLAVDADLLASANRDKLKGLVTMSVGHDNIDLEECKKRRLRVGFGASALTEVTAERTVALLLATSCRIPEACRAAREGLWPQATGHLSALNGKELEGSVVGFFGMGRIGKAAAKRLEGFAPSRIIYNCRQPKKELDGIYDYVTFDELLRKSDFLIVIAAANAQTMNVFNKSAFERMKPSSVLINFARGSLVQTDDLTEALSSRKIWAAGLDVTNPEPLPVGHKLYSLDNCVILPHIGAASDAAHRRVFELGMKNVRAILYDEPMPCPLLDDH